MYDLFKLKAVPRNPEHSTGYVRKLIGFGWSVDTLDQAHIFNEADWVDLMEREYSWTEYYDLSMECTKIEEKVDKLSLI